MDLLKHEWSGVLAILTSQCEQYSPKITLFGTLVLGSMAVAMKNPELEAVYVIAPLLTLMIGYVTVAHAYFITVLAGQMGLIERRIAQLNGDVPVMTTDHRVWRTLTLPPIVRFSMLRPHGKQVTMVNPLAGAAGMGVLVLVPVMIFCLVKCHGIIPAPFNYIYILLAVLAFSAMAFQSTVFFHFESQMALIDFGSRDSGGDGSV